MHEFWARPRGRTALVRMGVDRKFILLYAQNGSGQRTNEMTRCGKMVGKCRSNCRAYADERDIKNSRDTMAISNEVDEGIDFSDIEEKCVLAIELTASGISKSSL